MFKVTLATAFILLGLEVVMIDAKIHRQRPEIAIVFKEAFEDRVTDWPSAFIKRLRRD